MTIPVTDLIQKVEAVIAAFPAINLFQATSTLIERAEGAASRLASFPRDSEQAKQLAALGLDPGKDQRLFKAAHAHAQKLAQNMQKWRSKSGMTLSERWYRLFFKAVMYTICQDGLRRTLKDQASCTATEFENQMEGNYRDLVIKSRQTQPPAFKPAGSSVERVSLALENALGSVECFLMGSDEVALKAVAQKYGNPASEVRRIRDTHFRSSADFKRYGDASYELLESSALEFFKKGGKVEVVTGGSKDQRYIETIDRAEKTAGKEVRHVNRTRWYRFDTYGPLMNFIILEARESEVYFGWGRPDGDPAGAVFGSRDPTLVMEFNRLFESMLGVSDETTAGDLLDEIDGPVHARRSQDWSKLWDFLYRIERGADEDEADLRIVTTAFVSQTSGINLCKRLLKKGVRIQIIMMNPANSVLIEARFGLRVGAKGDGIGPVEATNDIRTQVRVLKQLQDLRDEFSGSLDIRTSDRMPIGFYALGAKSVIFGMMPAMGTYEVGPMFEAGSNTQFWRTIESDWKKRWPDAEFPKADDSPDTYKGESLANRLPGP